MRKEKFTPGPWYVSDRDKNVVHSSNKRIADCEEIEVGFGGNGEENAALIAAAPEMYEVIQGFLNLPTKCDAVFLQRYFRWTKQAEDVLKKARGEK